MTGRKYRVLVALTNTDLLALERDGWTLLKHTVREFTQLDTDDDHQLGDIGAVIVDAPGWVGIAFKNA